MSKILKSLRIEEELVERVEALKVEGETGAAVYDRVLTAGLEALEATECHESDAPRAVETEPPAGLVEALQRHIDTLEGQLALKDDQIKALTEITQAAQTLHGLATTKQLELDEGGATDTDEPRRGFFKRLFG